MSEFVHLLAEGIFESNAVVWKFLQFSKAASDWMPQIGYFSPYFPANYRGKLRKLLQGSYRRELRALAVPKGGLEPIECFRSRPFLSSDR
jgi:hypothetical protein